MVVLQTWLSLSAFHYSSAMYTVRPEQNPDRKRVWIRPKHVWLSLDYVVPSAFSYCADINLAKVVGENSMLTQCAFSRLDGRVRVGSRRRSSLDRYMTKSGLPIPAIILSWFASETTPGPVLAC